jgi:hypothetical protein
MQTKHSGQTQGRKTSLEIKSKVSGVFITNKKNSVLLFKASYKKDQILQKSMIDQKKFLHNNLLSNHLRFLFDLRMLYQTKLIINLLQSVSQI